MNRTIINKKEINIEIIELYSPKTKYEVLTFSKKSPGIDSIHHTYGVQYSLDFELQYYSKLVNGNDSMSIELSSFQIVKNNKSEYWVDDNEYQCFDTIKVVPVFTKNNEDLSKTGVLRNESGEIKFVHFGSCRRVNLTIQLGDRIIHTVQFWHKS